MKNIDIKAYLNKLAKNLGFLFFVAFLALLVLEAFEVKSSVDLVLEVAQEPAVPAGDPASRINFANYNDVVKRIEGADTFRPTGGILKDPFSVSYTPINISNPNPSGSTSPTEEESTTPVTPDDSSGQLKLN